MKNGSRDIFTTTRWTIVLRAGGTQGGSSTTAWQHLCKIYRYPLYSYARRTVASRYGFSESYLRVNTHRLSKRYKELIREEIAQTLENCEMVEDEIRSLFRAFS